MSVRLDRPPIVLFNRFECLEEEESYVYSIEELLAIRETVPKEDPVLKAAIEAIIGNKPAPDKPERKTRYSRQSAHHSKQNGRAQRVARDKLNSRPKDSAYRHFHTKKVWAPKNPAKK